jgi:serine phosphatase RsbU (regulator of sigma subunit)
MKEHADQISLANATIAELRQQLREVYDRLREESALAKHIQKSLLPRTLPDMPPLRLAVYHRPTGRLGGDLYDAFGIDENRVAFYLADVMSHGMSGCLQAMFLKQSISRDGVLSPAEVLDRLNRSILEQALTENPFITIIYGLYDHRARHLTLARAGHPQPIYIPHVGAPQRWHMPGSLLGVFETQFQSQTQALKPGDKVVLHSDGLTPAADTQRQDAEDRLLCSVAEARGLPIAELIAQVGRDLQAECENPDDITLFGLEITR